MAFKLPIKLDTKTIVMFVSLLLNLLGGTGTIEPVVGGPPECPSVVPALPPAE